MYTEIHVQKKVHKPIQIHTLKIYIKRDTTCIHTNSWTPNTWILCVLLHLLPYSVFPHTHRARACSPAMLTLSPRFPKIK